MRKKYYADENGHWVEARPREALPSVIVMPDIQPYQSMIDGSMINSRSKHRQHLKDHECIEIGNEQKYHLSHYDNLPDVAPQQRHDLIQAQIDAMSQKEFRQALKRDVDRVKWNSRKD